MKSTVAVALLVLCAVSGRALADTPIWAAALKVQATITECGAERTIVFKGKGVQAPPRTGAGCKSTDVEFALLNVSKAYFPAGYQSPVGAASALGYYIVCKSGLALTIGPPEQVTRSIRERPAPAACTHSTLQFKLVASAGFISFADVENGGMMSVAESLALGQKERNKIIADCTADPACRAEWARLDAISTYYQCMQPSPYDRICKRPW
jgi:hypothetical protein